MNGSERLLQESLNAHSEYTTSQDDGVAEHRINQYLIKQEIGRGSFGAVHLAVDQYGKEYVGVPRQVKEYTHQLNGSRQSKNFRNHDYGNVPSPIFYADLGANGKEVTWRQARASTPLCIASHRKLPPVAQTQPVLSNISKRRLRL